MRSEGEKEKEKERREERERKFSLPLSAELETSSHPRTPSDDGLVTSLADGAPEGLDKRSFHQRSRDGGWGGGGGEGGEGEEGEGEEKKLKSSIE